MSTKPALISETLSMWGNGAVTLPKKWRTRFGARHFFAQENELGYLVIKPVLTEDVVYYEDEEGPHLHFPHGIPAETLAQQFQEAHERITAEEKRSKKRVSKKSA